jgi:hypothetical protein
MIQLTDIFGAGHKVCYGFVLELFMDEEVSWLLTVSVSFMRNCSLKYIYTSSV